MAKLPSRLRRLDAALADLPGDDEPMLLTELDGFLAGVAVCPELVMPAEWLPCVWGGEGGRPFEDAVEARQFAAMVTAHYDEIVHDLSRGKYAPLLDIDERNGDILWELWIDGFAGAMALRPESWAGPADSEDEDVRMALAGMMALADIARDESDQPRALIDELTDEAPDLIPLWAGLLHRWRLAKHGAVAAPEAPAAKVGRNEPCPCGSGRKWKRCCGLD